MFSKKHHVIRRRRSSFGFLRTLMSLVMILVLSLGVYSAYKSFSGVDPLKISPQGIVKSLFNSDQVLQTLSGLLSINPKELLSKNGTTQKSGLTLGAQVDVQKSPEPTPTPRKILDFRFAVLADSENDNSDLTSALIQAKDAGAKFVVGLGDWSDVGTIDELKTVKGIFDKSGLKYYLIPGEHDLWDSRNRGLEATYDFKQVFGINYQTFAYSHSQFLLVDNSDNYHGIDQTQQKWIMDSLDTIKAQKPSNFFVFVSTPLYHPSSDHVMGKIEPSLKSQADYYISLFKDSGVSEILAGNTHFYASYTEPKSNLPMSAVGAITSTRNLQTSRFVLIDIYTDGSYNITDTDTK